MDALLALVPGGSSLAEWGPKLLAMLMWAASGLALAETLAYSLDPQKRTATLTELRRALPWAVALALAQIAALAVALLMDPDNDMLGDVSLLYLFFALLLPAMWAAGRQHASDAAMPRRHAPWPQRRTLQMLAAALAVGLCLNLLSVLVVDVRAGEQVTNMTRDSQPLALVMLAVWLMINSPWQEELIFRHYLVPRMTRYGSTPASRRASTVIAVIIAAAIFAIGHAGHMQPAWPKLMQVFGWGLILGWARVQFGTAYAIGLHLVWNLSAPLFAPFVHP